MNWSWNVFSSRGNSYNCFHTRLTEKLYVKGVNMMCVSNGRHLPLSNTFLGRLRLYQPFIQSLRITAFCCTKYGVFRYKHSPVINRTIYTTDVAVGRRTDRHVQSKISTILLKGAYWGMLIIPPEHPSPLATLIYIICIRSGDLC